MNEGEGCHDRDLSPCRLYDRGLFSGARVGVDGRLCKGHYARRDERLRRAAKAKVAVIAEDGAEPCTACGTTGGLVRERSIAPVRYRVFRSTLCHACRFALDGPRKPRVDGPVPTVTEIRERTLAIRPEVVTRWEGPRKFEPRGPGVSPAEGARQAIKEYTKTIARR